MNYHNITYPDMNNGEGLRVVLWLSGCSHKCKGCQNPQTWDTNSGIPFDESAKEELFRELDKDYISGLTLTGGDPLFNGNLEDVLELVNSIRKSFPQKTIWIYTGYLFGDIIRDQSKYEIIKNCDVLIDGRYIESLRDITLKWCGSSNQNIIDIQKSLREGEVIFHSQRV